MDIAFTVNIPTIFIAIISVIAIIYQVGRFTRGIEARLDRHEEKLNRHEEKFDQIVAILDRHEEKFDQIIERLDRHEERLNRHEEKFDQILFELVEIRRELIKSHQNLLDHLTKHHKIGS